MKFSRAKNFYFRAKAYKGHHWTLSADDSEALEHLLSSKQASITAWDLSLIFLGISRFKKTLWKDLSPSLAQNLLRAFKQLLIRFEELPPTPELGPQTREGALRLRTLPNKSVLRSRDLACILGSLGKLKISWKDIRNFGLDEPLFAAIYHLAPSCNAQDLVEIFFGLIIMDRTWKNLENAHIKTYLLQAISNNVNNFSAINLANLLSSLSNIGSTGADLEALGSHCTLYDVIFIKQGENFTPNELSRVLWALASMRITWDDLAFYGYDRPLIGLILKNAPQFDNQSTYIVSHALFTMEISPEAMRQMRAPLIEAITRHVNKFTPREAKHILWVQALYDFNLPLETSAKLHNLAAQMPLGGLSSIQSTFSQLFKEALDSKTPCIHRINDLLDVMVCLPEDKLIIEVQAPNYIHNPLIHRLLTTKLGWKIEYVTHEENDGEKEEENQYVEVIFNILKKHGLRASAKFTDAYNINHAQQEERNPIARLKNDDQSKKRKLHDGNYDSDYEQSHSHRFWPSPPSSNRQQTFSMVRGNPEVKEEQSEQFTP